MNTGKIKEDQKISVLTHTANLTVDNFNSLYIISRLDSTDNTAIGYVQNTSSTDPGRFTAIHLFRDSCTDSNYPYLFVL